MSKFKKEFEEFWAGCGYNPRDAEHIYNFIKSKVRSERRYGIKKAINIAETIKKETEYSQFAVDKIILELKEFLKNGI